MTPPPRRAMVLAAGLGARMRPITDTMPKPLVKVAGRAMLDHMLDKLADAGVETAVVNVHYLADQIERHVASRDKPSIAISDERSQLLDTGGGVVKALDHLREAPFFHVNADTLWLDGAESNLQRLAGRFDVAAMDAILLLAPREGSLGYAGRGDYTLSADERLTRRGDQPSAPYVYAGAAVLAPGLFAGAPDGPFSLTRLFNKAEAAGRLFGLPLDGLWMHVGTPDAIGLAEAAIRQHSG
jgi:N-acetyl-alpha-D-muramate 1-phosphate uridylyltransferase